VHTLLEKWLRNKEGVIFCYVLANGLLLSCQIEREGFHADSMEEGCCMAALFLYQNLLEERRGEYLTSKGKTS
jgi:hypothetical protein